MHVVASTTLIPKSGCTVRIPRIVDLEIFRIEPLRRVSDNWISGVKVVVSMMPIPDSDCPERILGQVVLETLILERFR